jgi:hypothetical protein
MMAQVCLLCEEEIKDQRMAVIHPGFAHTACMIREVLGGIGQLHS